MSQGIFMLDLEKQHEVGFVLDLAKEFPALTRLRLITNWEMHPVFSADKTKGFDLDLFMFVLNNAGKVIAPNKVVFFNNQYYPKSVTKADLKAMTEEQKEELLRSSTIAIPKDNQTGEDDGTGEDEFGIVDYDKRQPGDKTVAVYCFVHKAMERQHHLGMIKNAYVKVVNDDTDEELAHFNLTTDHSGKTCVHIGDIVFGAAGFEFIPVGKGDVKDPNQVVQFYM
jgi:tellurium resistance protein TerD